MSEHQPAAIEMMARLLYRLDGGRQWNEVIPDRVRERYYAKAKVVLDLADKLTPWED